MVRVLLSLFLLVAIVQASALNEKIESFIGKKEYRTQKNLIHILFKRNKNYLNRDNSVNDMKVLAKLKSSGLLKLFYKRPQNLKITFSTRENPLIFMRVINESLQAMGYSFFLTKKAVKSEKGFLWQIAISTEHIVDPLNFSKWLNDRGCYIEGVARKSENNWHYNINTDQIKVSAITIDSNTFVDLKKPIKPYWVTLDNIATIKFRTHRADNWYPKIIFYDEKLHIVRDFRRDSLRDDLTVRVPEDAKYVKISDLYTLDNIKRGLSLFLNGRE